MEHNEIIKAINELEQLKRESNTKCRKEISNIQLKNRLAIGWLNREIEELKADLLPEELELLNERKIAV